MGYALHFTVALVYTLLSSYIDMVLQAVTNKTCQPSDGFQSYMHDIQFLDSEIWLQNLDRTVRALN